jgi:hypothetical protein
MGFLPRLGYAGVLRGLAIGLKIVRPEGASHHNRGPVAVDWLIVLEASPEISPLANGEISGDANGEPVRLGVQD